jgi:hypothetical protein
LDTFSAGEDLGRWPHGKGFEHVVLRAFEIEGARVRWPYEVRIGGDTIEQIDGAIYHNGHALLIEAKHYRDPANIEPITKLRAQLARRPPATIGMVFSFNGFTEPAKILARHLNPQQILLWEGAELRLAIEKNRVVSGLEAKLRYAVEQGFPDYSLSLEAW